MLKILNCGPEEFKKRIIGRDVYVYGAGRALESNMSNYFYNIPIKGIIDKDSERWGEVIENNCGGASIIGLEHLINRLSASDKENILLFITSQFYAAEIVEELDRIPELDGVECYIHIFIKNTKEELIDFQFTEGERLIPKTIHYIWFGKKELPEEFKKNIETWKQYNPDYEIVRWDETNYDLDKNAFVREAYAAGKWSKVANYARVDILFENGGIYLDTDVEIIKSFDCLLNDEAFFCLGNQDSVNNGCGLGSVAGNKVIKSIKDGFEAIHFDVDKGGVGMKSAHNFMDPPLKRYGFVMENRYQKIGKVVLYPKEVLAPLTFGNLPDFFTDKTLSIHYEAGSWEKSNEKDGIKKLEELFNIRIKSI